MRLLITIINIWVIRGRSPSWPYRVSPSYPKAALDLGRHLLAKHHALDQNFLLYLLTKGSNYSNITSKSIEWLISFLQHENMFELKLEQGWRKTCSERSWGWITSSACPNTGKGKAVKWAHLPMGVDFHWAPVRVKKAGTPSCPGTPSSPSVPYTLDYYPK